MIQLDLTTPGLTMSYCKDFDDIDPQTVISDVKSFA
jgi:hypothetical protein